MRGDGLRLRQLKWLLPNRLAYRATANAPCADASQPRTAFFRADADSLQIGTKLAARNPCDLCANTPQVLGLAARLDRVANLSHLSANFARARHSLTHSPISTCDSEPRSIPGTGRPVKASPRDPPQSNLRGERPAAAPPSHLQSPRPAPQQEWPNRVIRIMAAAPHTSRLSATLKLGHGSNQATPCQRKCSQSRTW